MTSKPPRPMTTGRPGTATPTMSCSPVLGLHMQWFYFSRQGVARKGGLRPPPCADCWAFVENQTRCACVHRLPAPEAWLLGIWLLWRQVRCCIAGCSSCWCFVCRAQFFVICLCVLETEMHMRVGGRAMVGGGSLQISSSRFRLPRSGSSDTQQREAVSARQEEPMLILGKICYPRVTRDTMGETVSSPLPKSLRAADRLPPPRPEHLST